MTCTIEGCDRPVRYTSLGLCNRCYQRQHYEANREAYAAAQRQRILADPEKRRETDRKAGKKYRDAHPEVARARKRRWRLLNPEKEAAQQRRRRVRVGGHGYQKYRLPLWHEQGGRCARCRKPVLPIGTDAHVDHVHPSIRGGSSERENLQVLCPPCNYSKWARIEVRR